MLRKGERSLLQEREKREGTATGQSLGSRKVMEKRGGGIRTSTQKKDRARADKETDLLQEGEKGKTDAKGSIRTICIRKNPFLSSKVPSRKKRKGLRSFGEGGILFQKKKGLLKENSLFPSMKKDRTRLPSSSWRGGEKRKTAILPLLSREGGMHGADGGKGGENRKGAVSFLLGFRKEVHYYSPWGKMIIIVLSREKGRSCRGHERRGEKEKRKNNGDMLYQELEINSSKGKAA